MRKLLAVFIICLLVLQSIPLGIYAYSDPISHGKMNTVTYVYWGKSELFPILGLVGPNEEFDVYEYDENWVMILYDTYITQGYSGSGHSFFGYVKRNTITCDPELEGDKSDKADTGPGKRKGKKPKTPKKPAEENPTDRTGAKEASTAPEGTNPGGQTSEPESSVEVTDEEYDWIIRTPGVCTITVPVEQAKFTCSFSLMAQKAGGLGPSSDPAFNHGMHTPYAATAFFSMVSPMQSMIENMGEASKYLSGSGGVELSGQTGGATFYLDTSSLDPALVNFSITLQGTAVLNPSVTDGNLTVDAGETRVAQNFPLPIQLKKAGSGYKFVLKGMKPGGGDLTFPAVMEKTFADPDRWDKAAKDADKQRKRMEQLRKRMLEKIKEMMKDEWGRQQKEQSDKEASNTKPLPPLPPLTDEYPELPPLVPDDSSGSNDNADASTLPLPPLAPLWPTDDENATGFPTRNP